MFEQIPAGVRLFATALLTFVLPGTFAVIGADKEPQSDWTKLFNGKDLSGWDTWLGRPKGQKDAVGLNKDPKSVYSVTHRDGQPVIRISGEIMGALYTKKAYGNYHLRLEFKWGDKKWDPQHVKDSGLLYHCFGAYGAVGTYWMQGLQCQIKPHDCGEFVSAIATADVEGVLRNDGTAVYRKGSPTI
jgi:hypothetical protein